MKTGPDEIIEQEIEYESNGILIPKFMFLKY